MEQQHLPKEVVMHIAKDQIPAKINAPGAVAREAADFGDATGLGKMAGEYFSLAAGNDTAPLLKGLKDNACQVPHWGYMLSGEVLLTYSDGNVETCIESDLFYWPPGHTVQVVRDTEVILFSPQVARAQVIEHQLKMMKG
jgi:hypothetical protein